MCTGTWGACACACSSLVCAHLPPSWRAPHLAVRDGQPPPQLLPRLQAGPHRTTGGPTGQASAILGPWPCPRALPRTPRCPSLAPQWAPVPTSSAQHPVRTRTAGLLSLRQTTLPSARGCVTPPRGAAAPGPAPTPQPRPVCAGPPTQRDSAEGHKCRPALSPPSWLCAVWFSPRCAHRTLSSPCAARAPREWRPVHLCPPSTPSPAQHTSER